MIQDYMMIEPSGPLEGTAQLVGAKNAVLVIMASLLLTRGKSTLFNVPHSDDVIHMVALLRSLGADIVTNFDENVVHIDTSHVDSWQVEPEIMNKMRASILVMGPLLATFGKAAIALPGGCVIGSRPIDYHLALLKKMGVLIVEEGTFLSAQADKLVAKKLVLEYPSVGATENCLMAAVLTPGQTVLVNAALEPEVLDLIEALKKMGARISIQAPAQIIINGVDSLLPINHTIIVDRLEAGALLLAGAITGGDIHLPTLPIETVDVFLEKLKQMGHEITIGSEGFGVRIKAIKCPRSVSFKTGPHPSFPTDLQAPMSAVLSLASGVSVVEETVFENRLLHVFELHKMGAQISVEHTKAIIRGVDQLYGSAVIATDIRASCALVLAGLSAQGITVMSGLHHWRRGYDGLERKLNSLGARISIVNKSAPLGPLVNKIDLNNKVIR